MTPDNEFIIGIDFDNTLVTYDGLFHGLGRERGLIPASVPKSKKAVRDAVRRGPEGEIQWQELQALVYGPLIHQAKPAPGTMSFLKRCHIEGAVVHVVSHKTEFAARNSNGFNLQTAALGWLEANGFFDASGAALCRENVHFLPTRFEKIEKIKKLKCRFFIDDLQETFVEAGFPVETAGILYAFHPEAPPRSEVAVAGSFQDVETIIFG